MLSISTIIPTFNSAPTIIRALDSVFSQTHPPAEVIVIDDCSTDSTEALVTAYMSTHNYPIKLICLAQNRGPSHARNLGWSLATSEYIAFLDSDDVWLSEKLAMQVDFFKAHPDAVICGHNFSIFDSKSRSGHVKSNFLSFSYLDLLIKNRFSTPTIILRRNVDFRFCENLRGAEDYALWLDIAYKYGSIPKIDQNLASCYKRLYGESGLSAKLLYMWGAELTVIKDQFSKKRIGAWAFTSLLFWSLMKFSLRAPLALARRFAKKVM